MAYSLTKQQDDLYTNLVKEYNEGNYEKVCSLDTFIKNKWLKENDERKAAELYQVWWFSCEDF